MESVLLGRTTAWSAIIAMKIPSLPFAEFASLVGPGLFPDLCRLYVRSENHHLVLFSDTGRRHVAILPVGPNHPHQSLEAIDPKIKIEGLSPLCSLPTPGTAVVTVDNVFAEECRRQQALQQALEKRETVLLEREQFVAECEARMGEVGQALTEREAWIDQREQTVAERERAFFKRSGERAPGSVAPIEILRA